MFGFGDKKKKEEEEKAKQEQLAQAMKSMSDQIAGQAQTIKQLQDRLTAAKADDAASSAAAKDLAAAQAQLKQMHDEMEKVKSSGAAATAAAANAGKAAASSLGSAVAGAVGVTKIGPSAGAAAGAATLGGAAPAATGGLAVGGTAYVQKAGGKNLRLRDAAGLSSNAFDALHPGTQMTLLGGPVEKDGYTWWHIRAADGREGWVAGSELLTHPE